LFSNSFSISSIVGKLPFKLLVLDIADDNSILSFNNELFKQISRLDVLINNAGIAGGLPQNISTVTIKNLRNVFETNFFGAVAVMKTIIPPFRKQRSGAIVNISSLGGQLSYAGFGAYSASKFALEGISEALAPELAPFGIKVLIVEPGQFRTELAGAAMKHMPEIDAYKDTVGKTRDFAKTMGGTQEGDPLKAAAAIEQAIQAATTPLRLQLGKDAVDAHRIVFARGPRNLRGVVAAGSGDHRHLAVCFLQGDFDSPPALGVRERGAFAGRSAGHQKMDSCLDLPPHQSAQSSFIDRKVILKWSNQCRTATREHDLSPYRSPLHLLAVFHTNYALTQFVYNLSKFKHAGFPKNPTRRPQGTTSESFTASRRVANGDRVGTRIEANLVRPGMSARATGA